jgi:hypothetical protein
MLQTAPSWVNGQPHLLPPPLPPIDLQAHTTGPTLQAFVNPHSVLDLSGDIIYVVPFSMHAQVAPPQPRLTQTHCHMGHCTTWVTLYSVTHVSHGPPPHSPRPTVRPSLRRSPAQSDAHHSHHSIHAAAHSCSCRVSTLGPDTRAPETAGPAAAAAAVGLEGWLSTQPLHHHYHITCMND